MMKSELRNGSVECWRDPTSDKEQARLSLRCLEGGLKKLREESWRLNREMRSEMSKTCYLRIDRQIRKRTRKTRSVEKHRLSRKVFNIRRRKENCGSHLICKWIRKFKSQILKDRKEDISFDEKGGENDEKGGEKNEKRGEKNEKRGGNE